RVGTGPGRSSAGVQGLMQGSAEVPPRLGAGAVQEAEVAGLPVEVEVGDPEGLVLLQVGDGGADPGRALLALVVAHQVAAALRDAEGELLLLADGDDAVVHGGRLVLGRLLPAEVVGVPSGVVVALVAL